MRHSKLFISLSALLVFALLTAVALAESALDELWISGCDFLFRTDNVTVDGEVSFSLDGEWFKTAQLHYVQEGYNSLYDLKLLTPRDDGAQRETGWTIIADKDGNYAVMEVYHPGAYRMGVDSPQNTLLRRSVQLDALTELGGVIMGQVEPLLPKGAVTAEKTEGGVTVRVTLNESETPDMAVSALNVAAGFLADRWFSYSHDRSVAADECVPFENYVTVTQALTDGTVRWALRQADAAFSLDDQGRLTAAKGSVRAASTFWDGAVREVEVRFDLDMTGYGESRVKPFDPADYNVTLARDFYSEETEYPGRILDEKELDRWADRAVQLMRSQGYDVSPEADRIGWCDPQDININIVNPDGTEYYCCFAENGHLLGMENLSWFGVDEKEAVGVDDDTQAAARALILAFVKEQNPSLLPFMDHLALETTMTSETGGQYLSFSEAEYGVAIFVVQTEPALRIEYYTGADME